MGITGISSGFVQKTYGNLNAKDDEPLDCGVPCWSVWTLDIVTKATIAVLKACWLARWKTCGVISEVGSRCFKCVSPALFQRLWFSTVVAVAASFHWNAGNWNLAPDSIQGNAWTYAARYNDYVGERCLALIWLRFVHFGQDQTMPTQWKPQSSGDFTIVPEGNFFAEHCALVRSGNQSRCCCLDTALAIPADSPGPMHQPQRSGHGVPHSTPFTFVYHHSKMSKKRSNC